MTWHVEHHRESAATFHARPLPSDPARAISTCDPTGPALVLGSAQRDDVVDRAACARAGVDVVRRRSGGGAVLVEREALLWVDVLVPRSDELWHSDVGRSFGWLGATWQRALAEVGVSTRAHEGPMVTTRWSRLVCFAGLGPGELTDERGRKVLGMSQRRTATAARFQCAVLAHWRPQRLLALLSLDASERDAAAADLAEAAASCGADLEHLLAAFLRQLP
ncbi:MAG: lipoyl protein ligase domain-containing protein [Microthrixaceae bacterium]